MDNEVTKYKFCKSGWSVKNCLTFVNVNVAVKTQTNPWDWSNIKTAVYSFQQKFLQSKRFSSKAQQLIDCSHWKARSKGKLWFKVCRRLRGTFLCQQPRLRILNWKTNPIHVVCFNTSRSQWRCVILTRSCNLQDGSFCHIYIFCFLNIH